jgi:N-glycosylase/DNA lyase
VTRWEFALVGAGGEPISFQRTIHSHGCANLPPAKITGSPPIYIRALRAGRRVVEVTMEEDNGKLLARSSEKLGRRDAAAIEATIGRMFRFHDDLAPFYALISDDELLGWAARGAGRILASPSVFEDVVKTICTTNCSWSATIRMTSALASLGEGAFPDAAVLAATPEAWYRDVARMGYRGSYVQSVAQMLAEERLDLEPAPRTLPTTTWRRCSWRFRGSGRTAPRT